MASFPSTIFFSPQFTSPARAAVCWIWTQLNDLKSTCFVFALHPSYLALGLLSLVFLLLSYLHSHSAKAQDIRTILQALLTLVTPTCSIWSPLYIALAHQAAASETKALILTLDSLVADVIAGRVDFRDAQDDLPDLFMDNFKTYAWSIRLTVGIYARMKVLLWLFVSELPSFKYSFENVLDISICRGSHPVSKLNPLNHGATKHLHPQYANLSLTLDYTPYAHLEPFFRTLQSSLMPGATVSIEFTTFSPSINRSSDAFIFSAFPLMPKSRKHVKFAHKRTCTPLRTSLPHIIGLLSSGPQDAPLTIVSVRNVSHFRASQMNAYVMALEDDKASRRLFVDKWGMEGWREERLLTSWEAALFNANILSRWIVAVKKC